MQRSNNSTTRRLPTALIKLHGIIVCVSEDWVSGSGFEAEELLNGGLECFVDVGGALRARLEEWKSAVGVAPSADLLRRHWTGIWKFDMTL